MTIGLLAGACIGAVIGVYLERSFDVSFYARDLWDDFKEWRKG